MTSSANEVLEVWFGDDLGAREAVAERSRLWFASDDAFDRLLRERFGDLPDRALRGELDDWKNAARSTLALVIVLDQFPRNLHRGSDRAFAYDPQALAIARDAVDRGLDRELHPLEAVFLYLPFEHAEDPGLQSRCVELFRDLRDRAPDGFSDQFDTFLQFAERHRVVIERFGRFPHRNAILGRESTDDERQYLRSGGESFSGGEGDRG